MDHKHNWKYYYDECEVYTLGSHAWKNCNKNRLQYWSFSKPCPNFTHHPKQFSWNQAAQLCHHVNATLPEFISRKDQEEFSKILKTSTYLYPMEAIFIGLFHSIQVFILCSCNGKIQIFNG